ncbi:hypothetical protein PSPO01_13870 [Paraphaeosphaeria sporulosa]
MQDSMGTYHNEIKRQTESSAGNNKTEKFDDDLGSKSTISISADQDPVANNRRPDRRRRADSFSLTGVPSSESDNPDVANPACNPSLVNPRDSTVVASSPPKLASRSASIVAPPSPRSLQNARCIFCKQPSNNPNLTSCAHIVCCYCVGDELDRMYEHKRHHTCPACWFEIRKVTLLRCL